jgi:hypothetical protein
VRNPEEEIKVGTRTALFFCSVFLKKKLCEKAKKIYNFTGIYFCNSSDNEFTNRPNSSGAALR